MLQSGMLQSTTITLVIIAAECRNERNLPIHLIARIAVVPRHIVVAAIHAINI